MRPRLLPLLLLGCTGPNDTDTSADTDTVADTDSDADADVPWSWCPAADSAVTPGGDGRLAAAGQVWCAIGDEGVELADEPARKAQLLVVAGDYPLPTTAVNNIAFQLPVCTKFADGTHADADGMGTISGWSEPYGDVTWWRWTYDQPMTRGSVPYAFSLDLHRQDPPSVTAPVVTMDHRATLPWGENTVNATLLEGSYPSYDAWWSFVPCEYADPPRIDTTHVTFEGGQADLVVNMGQSMASTEPAMFVRASGTLDGVAFDVTDYWQLIYNPEHHHFTRHFAVKFDAPIGEACALVVRDVDAYYGPDYGVVATVELARCDLSAIEERAVTAQTTDRESTY